MTGLLAILQKRVQADFDFYVRTWHLHAHLFASSLTVGKDCTNTVAKSALLP